MVVFVPYLLNSKVFKINALTGFYRLLVFTALLFFCLPGHSQKQDTIIVDPGTSHADTSLQAEHSPRQAMIYSAVLPGLGQIYNKKWWKVPIVYVGFGTLAGSTIYNATNYRKYKDKYIYMLENSLEEYEGQSIPEVQWYKDTHRRYRDLFIIVTAGFYLLQIIDASVDAYLINFDVSDDLSMKINPVMIPPSGTEVYSLGLRCCLSF